MGCKGERLDLSGLDNETKAKLESMSPEDRLKYMGIGGTIAIEAVPRFNKAENETVYEGQNNAFIVLGRDRYGAPLSGYGGDGETQCGAIDIVVGRMGCAPARVIKKAGGAETTLYANSDFRTDSARIYLSQKSDIDKYFGLPDGKVGNSVARSAVAIKADAVRLIGREGIKLVSYTDAKNSQGGGMSTKGIDIIAGADGEDLQPMVKGKNLELALDKLLKYFDKLAGIMDSFLTYQMNFNKATINHDHHSPFFAHLTLPSRGVMQEGTKAQIELLKNTKHGIKEFKDQLDGFRHNYFSQMGPHQITSKHHNLN